MVMSKSAYPAYQLMHRQCSLTIAVTVNCAPVSLGAVVASPTERPPELTELDGRIRGRIRCRLDP
jgi:hypothetical protein